MSVEEWTKRGGGRFGTCACKAKVWLEGTVWGYEALNLNERTPALSGICHRESRGVAPLSIVPPSPKQAFNTRLSTISTRTYFLAVVIEPSPLLQTEAHEPDERG